MSIAERTKEAGGIILGIAVMAGLVALGIGLITGAAAFSIWVLEWTFPAFSNTLAISLILLGPLALIPPTRGFSAIGFTIASFVFGAILWLWGLGYTYTVWGMFGVLIGLVFLGVGIVPVAMVAALLHGDWGNLGMFVFAVVVTFGTRGLGAWLADKADERAARLVQTTNIPPARTVRDES